MEAYYDAEAPVYDETRGGSVRARAAAEAVLALAPRDGLCLDVGGGTGIVGAELAARGLTVVVTDLSHGMLQQARARLPGRVAVARADRLPLRDGSVDMVTALWLLHLLEPELADRVLAEAARVLRRGGTLVTTVDKDHAHGRDRRTDADARDRRTDADARDRVVAVAARVALSPAGATSFTGPTKWDSATDGDPVFPVLALKKHTA